MKRHDLESTSEYGDLFQGLYIFVQLFLIIHLLHGTWIHLLDLYIKIQLDSLQVQRGSISKEREESALEKYLKKDRKVKPPPISSIDIQERGVGDSGSGTLTEEKGFPGEFKSSSHTRTFSTSLLSSSLLYERWNSLISCS